MNLPNDKWDELPGCPGYYVLKEYTADQIAMLNRRPTEFIDAALGRMAIDRGTLLETTVLQPVDTSSEIAGLTACIECGGDGNWGKFAPEIVGADCPCVECKGTGKIWVSI